MAEITFPNAPTLNEVYEAENGIKYQWDGEKWSTLPDSEGQIPSGGDPGQFLAKASVADYDLEWVDAAPPTTIGTSPPTEDLEEGQLWWRSDTGVLYIYYVDENSSQWVQAAVGTDTRVQAQIYTGDVPPIGPGEGDLWWNTTDTNLYIYYQGYWVQSTSSDGGGGGVEEAPTDGQQYARQNGDWSVVTGGGAGGGGTVINYNGASAWGYVGKDGTLKGGLNISSIDRGGSTSATYQVNFATPMPDSNYSITGSAVDEAGEGRVWNFSQRTTSGFVATVRDPSTGSGSPGDFAFAVFASNAIAPQSGVGADAWVSADGQGPTSQDARVLNGYNVSQVERTGIGSYLVRFITNMPNALYAVAGSAVGTVVVGDRYIDRFEVFIDSSDGNRVDENFQIIVQGSSTVTPTFTWTRTGTTLSPANDGDNVTVDASVYAGTIQGNGGANSNGINFRGISADVETFRVDTDGSITAAGSGTFNGVVETSNLFQAKNSDYPQVRLQRTGSGSKTNVNWTSFLDDAGSYVIKNETDSIDALKANKDGSITAAGNGTFAGTGIFGGDADDGANPGIRLAPVGAIAACRAAGNTAVFSGYTEGTSTPNISLNADGSSSFKGAIEVDRSQGAETGVIIREAGTARTRLFASGNITAAGTLTCGPYNPGSASAHGATLNVDGTVGTCQIQAADGTATNASAIVVRLGASTAWTVNYGGDAAFRNAFLKLDPDNSANYDSYGNYTGATLDVKDKLQKAVTALTTIKAAASDSYTDLAGLKAAIVNALVNF